MICKYLEKSRISEQCPKIKVYLGSGERSDFQASVCSGRDEPEQTTVIRGGVCYTPGQEQVSEGRGG